MHSPNDPVVGDFQRVRLRVWEGPGLLTDYRTDEPKPHLMVNGWHALTGLEIPFLPEPFGEEGSRSSRPDAHRERFLHEMLRMVHGLYVPETWRGPAWERLLAFTTFDLRIISRPGNKGPGRLRLFILVKVFVPVDDRAFAARAQQLAGEHAVVACRLCRAVAPRVLTLQPIVWNNGTSISAPDTPEGIPVTDEDLGLAEGFSHIGELRRENILTTRQPKWTYTDFCESLSPLSGSDDENRTPVYSVPSLWPSSSHDLLPTCSVMATAVTPVVLSVRLQPTLRTRYERKALHELQSRLQELIEKKAQGRTTLMHARNLTWELFSRRELFLMAVQVAGTSAATVNEVLTTLAGEQAVARSEPGKRPALHSRPARVMCLHPKELAIASFNLRRVELWPWGAVDERVQDATRPAGTYPPSAPDLSAFPVPDELLTPEVFLQRDLEHDPQLARFRALVSIDEAGSIWRLPVVGAGGQAGLTSRLPNPFEQLPCEPPLDENTISLGLVQHRGISTNQDYRVPLLSKPGSQPGIGDRVIVVAGSPGSGKTNFCLHFLEQLWNEAPSPASPSRIPYLVIDPTRGMEFRWLLNSAPNNLVIFTVGDVRGVPFCFNPLIVPKNVSLQAHISRLMACFRSAYFMWDPLPAIFEEAIRHAYRRRFTSRGKPWNPVEEFGTGRAEDYPTLEDVCEAMGSGAPDEEDTVLANQRQLWSADGQGTENQATIVASTYLRLRNLRDNYDHVIGGPGAGRHCVDLSKLLRVPAVLELGMIGDSQALSLVMAFLVVSLVGCIENRDRTIDPMHMLVIEEAHRLLSAEGGSSQEGSSSRVQAAEDINNLLAEVRKYGQGVMLLDQRPGSLVGGVIDNAFLVALHRLNERKSFEQFADVLNLSADQRRFARIGLQPGQMIVLDRPSGTPVVLRPPSKPKEEGRKDDQWLTQRSRHLVQALMYEVPDRPATNGRIQAILNKCDGRPELQTKLDGLRKTLAGGSPSIKRVLRLVNDIVIDLGIGKTERNSFGREFVMHLARQEKLPAEVMNDLEKGISNG